MTTSAFGSWFSTPSSLTAEHNSQALAKALIKDFPDKPESLGGAKKLKSEIDTWNWIDEELSEPRTTKIVNITLSDEDGYSLKV